MSGFILPVFQRLADDRICVVGIGTAGDAPVFDIPKTELIIPKEELEDRVRYSRRRKKRRRHQGGGGGGGGPGAVKRKVFCHVCGGRLPEAPISETPATAPTLPAAAATSNDEPSRVIKVRRSASLTSGVNEVSTNNSTIRKLSLARHQYHNLLDDVEGFEVDFEMGGATTIPSSSSCCSLSAGASPILQSGITQGSFSPQIMSPNKLDESSSSVGVSSSRLATPPSASKGVGAPSTEATKRRRGRIRSVSPTGERSSIHMVEPVQTSSNGGNISTAIVPRRVLEEGRVRGEGTDMMKRYWQAQQVTSGARARRNTTHIVEMNGDYDDARIPPCGCSRTDLQEGSSPSSLSSVNQSSDCTAKASRLSAWCRFFFEDEEKCIQIFEGKSSPSWVVCVGITVWVAILLVWVMVPGVIGPRGKPYVLELTDSFKNVPYRTLPSQGSSGGVLFESAETSSMSIPLEAQRYEAVRARRRSANMFNTFGQLILKFLDSVRDIHIEHKFTFVTSRDSDPKFDRFMLNIMKQESYHASIPLITYDDAASRGNDSLAKTDDDFVIATAEGQAGDRTASTNMSLLEVSGKTRRRYLDVLNPSSDHHEFFSRLKRRLFSVDHQNKSSHDHQLISGVMSSPTRSNLCDLHPSEPPMSWSWVPGLSMVSREESRREASSSLINDFTSGVSEVSEYSWQAAFARIQQDRLSGELPRRFIGYRCIKKCNGFGDRLKAMNAIFKFSILFGYGMLIDYEISEAPSAHYENQTVLNILLPKYFLWNTTALNKQDEMYVWNARKRRSPTDPLIIPNLPSSTMRRPEFNPSFLGQTDVLVTSVTRNEGLDDITDFVARDDDSIWGALPSGVKFKSTATQLNDKISTSPITTTTTSSTTGASPNSSLRGGRGSSAESQRLQQQFSKGGATPWRRFWVWCLTGFRGKQHYHAAKYDEAAGNGATTPYFADLEDEGGDIVGGGRHPLMMTSSTSAMTTTTPTSTDRGEVLWVETLLHDIPIQQLMEKVANIYEDRIRRWRLVPPKDEADLRFRRLYLQIWDKLGRLSSEVSQFDMPINGEQKRPTALLVHACMHNTLFQQSPRSIERFINAATNIVFKDVSVDSKRKIKGLIRLHTPYAGLPGFETSERILRPPSSETAAAAAHGTEEETASTTIINELIESEKATSITSSGVFVVPTHRFGWFPPAREMIFPSLVDWLALLPGMRTLVERDKAVASAMRRYWVTVHIRGGDHNLFGTGRDNRFDEVELPEIEGCLMTLTSAVTKMQTKYANQFGLPREWVPDTDEEVVKRLGVLFVTDTKTFIPIAKLLDKVGPKIHGTDEFDLVGSKEVKHTLYVNSDPGFEEMYMVWRDVLLLGIGNDMTRNRSGFNYAARLNDFLHRRNTALLRNATCYLGGEQNY